VAEMMVKMSGTGAVVEKVEELLLCGGALRALPAFARPCLSRLPFGESDGAAIGKLQAVFVQTAVQGKARNFRTVLQTAELLLFDGKKNAVLIDKRDGCAVT